MPGTGFKKVAERYLRTNLDQTYRPLEFVKRRLVRLKIFAFTVEQNAEPRTARKKCSPVLRVCPLTE